MFRSCWIFRKLPSKSGCSGGLICNAADGYVPMDRSPLLVFYFRIDASRRLTHSLKGSPSCKALSVADDLLIGAIGFGAFVTTVSCRLPRRLLDTSSRNCWAFAFGIR